MKEMLIELLQKSLSDQTLKVVWLIVSFFVLMGNILLVCNV